MIYLFNNLISLLLIGIAALVLAFAFIFGK